MINQNLLDSAVNIRRKYLKVSNNMDLYHRRSKEIIEVLEKSINELEELSKRGDNTTSENMVKEIMKVIAEVEQEGNKLKELTDPMNKEIEKLQKEEQELYRIIKEKYPDLEYEAMINQIHTRLKQEGL